MKRNIFTKIRSHKHIKKKDTDDKKTRIRRGERGGASDLDDAGA
jgi:hypothetical protein